MSHEAEANVPTVDAATVAAPGMSASVGQSDESIRVLVRVRPNLEREEGSSQAVFVEGGKTVHLRSEKQTAQCTVHTAFDATSSQEDVYGSVGDCVHHVISGLNATILAYGQTSSGKTYTLFGPGGDTGKSTIAAAIALSRGQSAADANAAAAVNRALGMVPRAINNLFALLQTKNAAASDESNSEQHAQYTVYCSFLQLYNEKVFDLLQDPRSTAASQTLQVHEHDTDGVYVEGLSEYLVTSATDCLRLVAFGAANRAVRATSYNESSSRSHAILQLQIERQVSGDTRITRSKLNLVDLAGSERWDTNAPPGDGAHTSEMTHINLSLLTLSKCITSLARRDRKRGAGGSSPRLGHPSTSEGDRDSAAVHVPYRESKLTHLLKDALGGNSKTRLVCTLSPAMSSAAESFQTLIFADSAKRVMTHAKVNMSMLPDRVLVKLLQAEVERLRARLLQLGDVAGAFGKKGAPQSSSTKAIEDASQQPAAPRDPAEVAAALVGMERRLEEAHTENRKLMQKLQVARGSSSSQGHQHGGEAGGSAFFLTGVPGDTPQWDMSAGEGAHMADAQQQYALGESSLLQLKEAMDSFFNLDIEEEDLQAEVRRLIPAAHTHWAEGFRMLAAAAAAAAASQPVAAPAVTTPSTPAASTAAPAAVYDTSPLSNSGPRSAESQGGAASSSGAPPKVAESQRASTPQPKQAAMESSQPAEPAATGGRTRPSSRAGHAGVVSALRQSGAAGQAASTGASTAHEGPQSPQVASTAKPSVAASSGNPPASPLTTPRQSQADDSLRQSQQGTTRPESPDTAQLPQRRPSPPTQPLPAVSPPPSSRGGALRSDRRPFAEAAAAAGDASHSARRELAPVSGAGTALGSSGMLMRTRGRDGRLDAPPSGPLTAAKSTVTLPPLGGPLSPDDPEAKEAAIAERLKEVQREVARREKLAAWMEEKAKRQEAMLEAAKHAEQAAEEEEGKREKARQQRAKAVKKRLDRYKRKLDKQKAAEAQRAAQRSDVGSVKSAGKAAGSTKTKKKKRSKKGDGSSTAAPGSSGVHTPSSDAAGVGGGFPGMGHFPFSPQAGAAMTPQMAYALALQQQAAAAMAALQGGDGGAPGSYPTGFNPAFLTPPAAAYPWLAGQQVHPALAGGAAGGHSSAAAMAAWPLLGHVPAGDDDPNPVSVSTRDDVAHSARNAPQMQQAHAGGHTRADVPWAAPASAAVPVSSSMQGGHGAQGMAAIAAQAEQAVQHSRGGAELLPTGHSGAQDDLVGSDSEEGFTLPVPLTHSHPLASAAQGNEDSDARDVPLNVKYGGLSAPPPRSMAQQQSEQPAAAPAPGRRQQAASNVSPTKREKVQSSPRPTTSSGSNDTGARGADISSSARSSADVGGHDGGGQVSPREQREHKARSRQQQLAAVYAAPVVGKSRSTSRPKLRGLYNNAGFDRDEAAGGGGGSAAREHVPTGSRPASGEYSDDDFEYERAGAAEGDSAVPSQQQPQGDERAVAAGANGGEGGDLGQSASRRIDAGAAGNLLNMLDDL